MAAAIGPVIAGDDPAEGSISPFSSQASSPCFYHDISLTSTPIRQLANFIPPAERFKHSMCDSAQNFDTFASTLNTSTSDIDLHMYSDISAFSSFNMPSDTENLPVSSSFSKCADQFAHTESATLADVTPQEHRVAEEKELDFEDILTSPPVTYKLVFDNIDKTVKPRYMRMDAQNKSLHYVQLYAVKDRVNLSHLSPTPPSVCEVALDMILPVEDNASLMENI